MVFDREGNRNRNRTKTTRREWTKSRCAYAIPSESPSVLDPNLPLSWISSVSNCETNSADKKKGCDTDGRGIAMRRVTGIPEISGSEKQKRGLDLDRFFASCYFLFGGEEG